MEAFVKFLIPGRWEGYKKGKLKLKLSRHTRACRFWGSPCASQLLKLCKLIISAHSFSAHSQGIWCPLNPRAVCSLFAPCHLPLPIPSSLFPCRNNVSSLCKRRQFARNPTCPVDNGAGLGFQGIVSVSVICASLKREVACKVPSGNKGSGEPKRIAKKRAMKMMDNLEHLSNGES